MNYTSNAVQRDDDAISLLAVWQALRAEWRLLFSVVALFASLAIVIALVMTPVYQAEAIVTPVDANRRDSAASALLGQFGGLAGLAGINLNGLSGGPNKGRLMIQSRLLLEQFIQRNNLIPVLLQQDGNASAEPPPTLWRAVEAFKKIYNVTEDPETGLITVQVEWTDPRLAATWANGLVKLSNELLRQHDRLDSQRNIKYLNEQLLRTTVVGVQEAIYNLLEAEMKTLMLANAREEYALAVVDPAVVPELRSRPKRTQMVVLGTLLGGIVATFVIAVRRSLRAQKQRFDAAHAEAR